MAYMYVNTVSHDSFGCVAGLDSASSDKLIDWYYRVSGAGSWLYSGVTFCNDTDVVYYHTVSGLSPSVMYEIRADFWDGTTQVDEIIVSATTDSAPIVTRPSDFVWDTSKASGSFMSSYAGSPAPVTASEWISLQTRINDFRAYKTIGAYPFTTPTQGNPFQSYFFEQCRTAINEMSPPTSVPLSQYTGSVIMGGDGLNGLDRLRTSLNSIV